MTSASRYFLGVLGAFGLGLGAFAAASCTPDYDASSFRCQPRQQDNCPGGYTCCSDDPAALLGGLPSYPQVGGKSVPLFSAERNAVSASGLCVQADPSDEGNLPTGCPMPCNPTWSDGDVTKVCGSTADGEARVCCQTVELTEKDCIQDPNTKLWRPATGADILAGLTKWEPSAFDTHQDPGGSGCDSLSRDKDGVRNSDTYIQCLTRLSVADQRGFCVAPSARKTTCINLDEGYVDACTRKNQAG